MNISNAKSAKSAIQGTSSDIHTQEAFAAALARGLDKVWKRTFETPMQGAQYFREETLQRESATYQTYRGMGGLVPQNRDADDIPYATRGEGFGFTVNTFNYRRGVAIEKTLTEVDDIGVARGLQADLAHNAKMTIEYANADVLNRGIYVDGNSRAPFLCDDGCFLIDSGRPNANPEAGTWSNLEATGGITDTSLFTAQLNARAMTGEDGELYPTYIQKLVIRPADEKTVWTLLKSDLKTGTALNDKNFLQGKFEYEIYDYLTAANVYFLLGDPKSDMNELMFFWRVRPEFETWKDGSNPDITRQRVRFAFGQGCGSPRKIWRGGKTA